MDMMSGLLSLPLSPNLVDSSSDMNILDWVSVTKDAFLPLPSIDDMDQKDFDLLENIVDFGSSGSSALLGLEDDIISGPMDSDSVDELSNVVSIPPLSLWTDTDDMTLHGEILQYDHHDDRSNHDNEHEQHIGQTNSSDEYELHLQEPLEPQVSTVVTPAHATSHRRKPILQNRRITDESLASAPATTHTPSVPPPSRKRKESGTDENVLASKLPRMHELDPELHPEAKGAVQSRVNREKRKNELLRLRRVERKYNRLQGLLAKMLKSRDLRAVQDILEEVE